MTSFSTLQMISYNFNPYVSDSSSQRIRSKVVSLVLKDDTGKAFNTIDLPSDIEIDIPVSKYYLEDRTRSVRFNVQLDDLFKTGNYAHSICFSI